MDVKIVCKEGTRQTDGLTNLTGVRSTWSGVTKITPFHGRVGSPYQEPLRQTTVRGRKPSNVGPTTVGRSCLDVLLSYPPLNCGLCEPR